MNSLKIVVVDDSALFRTLIRNALNEIGGCEIVGSAKDGPSALQKIVDLKPDLVTLDIEMPDMDGIAVLRELKRRRIPSKVVMVSRLTSSGAQITTDALLEGAFDFILKPFGKDPAANKAELVGALEEKIAAVRDSGSETRSYSAIPVGKRGAKSEVHTDFEAVIIGCSTGGPDALGQILPFLRHDFPLPIVIVQHMPEGFTSSLSQRLNEASEIEVVEAADGIRLQKGLAILARGGRHLKLVRQGIKHVVTQLTDDPREHNCRPAIDYTIRSAVVAFDGPLVTAILTGMGRDGAEGSRIVREAGGEVIVQDAESCAVFGMPKSVIMAGQADEIVPLPKIANALETMVRRSNR